MYKSLRVLFNGRVVGNILEKQHKNIFFEYDDNWLKNEFSISPLLLQFNNCKNLNQYKRMSKLPGVIMECVARSQEVGMLAFDLLVKENSSLNHNDLSPIDYFSFYSNPIFGSFTFMPSQSFCEKWGFELLKNLNNDYKNLYYIDSTDDLDKHLFEKNIIKKNLRAYIYTKINGEEWFIKSYPFYGKIDSVEEREYKYLNYAKKCEIDTPEAMLLPSRYRNNYLAMKRYDKQKDKNIFAISAFNLMSDVMRLENTDEHSFDYNDLMKITWDVTNNYEDVEQVYKRMCFNVFACNYDDDFSQFSYLYDESEKRYKLAPIYDVCYYILPNRKTSVNGNSINPNLVDILNVAEKAGIERNRAIEIAKAIEAESKNLLKTI
jgi:serine/threonine-protein kinase HipA